MGWSIPVARAVSKQKGDSSQDTEGAAAVWVWDWDLLLGRALSVLGAARRAGKVIDGWVAF